MCHVNTRILCCPWNACLKSGFCSFFPRRGLSACHGGRGSCGLASLLAAFPGCLSQHPSRKMRDPEAPGRCWSFRLQGGAQVLESEVLGSESSNLQLHVRGGPGRQAPEEPWGQGGSSGQPTWPQVRAPRAAAGLGLLSPSPQPTLSPEGGACQPKSPGSSGSTGPAGGPTRSWGRTRPGLRSGDAAQRDGGVQSSAAFFHFHTSWLSLGCKASRAQGLPPPPSLADAPTKESAGVPEGEGAVGLGGQEPGWSRGGGLLCRPQSGLLPGTRKLDSLAATERVRASDQ